MVGETLKVQQGNQRSHPAALLTPCQCLSANRFQNQFLQTRTKNSISEVCTP